MIRYITIGTNDLDRACRFYDAVLPAIGMVPRERYQAEAAYGEPGGTYATFWVMRPFDGKPATVGNGSMPSFEAPSRAAVDAFHSAALAHGGTDEGAPGIRDAYGPEFYVAYVRDPDGNKLAAVCIGLA